MERFNGRNSITDINGANGRRGRGGRGGRGGGARRRLSAKGIAAIGVMSFVLIGLIAGLVFGLRGCGTAAAKRSLPFGANAEAAYTGNGFLYMDGRTLRFYSLNDENDNLSYPVEADRAMVAGTERIKVVYNTSSMQVVGTPFDTVIDGSIRKLVCGGKYVGVYTERDNGAYSLIVFNSAGTECYRADFTDTVLLDFGFEGGESAAIWMSELVTTGDAVTTTVTTYDLNRESITGVISVHGQVVKRLFLTKKSVFTYCTDSIIRFDRETNDEAYRLPCRGYECMDVSTYGARVYMLLSRTEASAPLTVLSLSENASPDEAAVRLPENEGALGCFLMNGRAVRVMRDRIIKYSDKAEVSRTIMLEESVEAAVKLDETSLLLTRGGEAMLYTIKK